MEPWMIIGGLVVVAVLGYLLWFGKPNTEGSRYDIIKGSIRGDLEHIETPALPLSYNQPQGLTYSYACWVLVKDFTVGYGSRRRIFSRGDSPGLYLDSTSNSFVVEVDTFGAKETILIPNIPAQKWVHFALVVDQHSVDVYINGMLRQHQTLAQLPRQKEEAIKSGPGWSGVLARLAYWARSITADEVKRLAADSLPDDMERRPAGPQYFDITWYIGRLYSA